MPKLKEATYAARRQHILDAARNCFSRKGFHAASMLDLQAEAGVSAGAIYVYFPSKDAIVNAITTANLERVTTVMTGIIDATPQHNLRDALTQAIVVTESVIEGPTRGIAFDVWGEGIRNEQVGTVLRQHFATIRKLYVELARRAIKSGELPKTADPTNVGAVLFSLVIPGYYTQRLVMKDITPESYIDGLMGMLGS